MMRAGLLGAALLAFAAPLVAQEASPELAQGPAEWRPVDAETGQIRDLEGLEALAADFPDSGSVRLRLLQAQLGAGDMPAVLVSLGWLKERGYVFSAGARAQIPQLVGEEFAEAASALILPDAERMEASELVATVPAAAGLVESVLSFDGRTSFMVTSITRNGVYLYDESGVWFDFGIGSNDLSGIAADPTTMQIWFSSSNLDGSQDEDEPFRGLIAADRNMALQTFAAPDGVTLSDLVVGPMGTIYASDPLAGGVYRLKPDIGVLEALVEPGTFRSPQGLAVSEDGARIYVSDYRYGLAMIDAGSGAVTRLAADIPVILDGTDALWLHDGELIAVQNGTSPMRISGFALSEDGTKVTGARVIERAHSGWTEPLGGSIAEDALVYISTGRWDAFDQGELIEGREFEGTEIRRLPLDNFPD